MRSLLSVLLCLIITLPLDAQQRVIRAITSGTTIQLDVSNLHYNFRTLTVKGVTYIKPEIVNATEAAHSARIGAPDVPYLSALIALPSDALPAIEVTEQQSYLRERQNIYPVQPVDQAARSQKNSPGISRASSLGSSTGNGAQLIELGKPEMMRGMYVVPVRINPLRYDPATEELRVYTSLRFSLHTSGVTIAAGRVPVASSTPESKAWDEFAAPLILNYRDALRWRTKPIRNTAAMPARMIVSPGQQRVKIFVNRNGIYRITANDLAAIGAPVSAMDPRTFHLYCFHPTSVSIPFMPDTGAAPLPPYQPDTIEAPLYLTGAADGSFDSGDTLQFYGAMHYGEEGDFYDDFTDDNVYWLTWGQTGSQKLYVPQQQLPPPNLTQDWSVKGDHYERDILYYLGDDVNGDYATIYVADKVPGERYYWQILDPNTGNNVFIQSFTIGGLPDVPGNATLRIHLRGVSSDAAVTPDHNVAVFLNSDSMADIQFNQFQDTIVTLTFPCKNLRNGRNDLSVVSMPLPTQELYSDQVAVDFFEVITPSEHIFTGDSIEFTAPAGGVSQFTLQDARSPNVTVYNASTGNIPSLVSSSGGTFVRTEARGFLDSRYMRVEVHDSIAAASLYARGFNVVAIDSLTGNPTDVKQFDTYQSQSASNALVQYIASVPAGTFLVFATCDEVTTNLTPAARAAIQALGSADIQQLGPNDGWTFVCQKGSSTFAPVEDLSRAGTGGAHLAATLPTAAKSSWKFVLRDSTVAGANYIAQTTESIAGPRALELRSVPSLESTANGADYIVVTHRNFLPAAQKLAQYRAQDNNYRTTVVDVEDIYDEFNGGIMRETPIKTFLQYAYRSWAAPAPSIAVLMGDASWDSKLNTPGAWRNTFVPSYGRPVSDYWFSLLEGNDLLPEILIGRIAASTEDTAMAVVNKIISYESRPPEQWDKKFLFVTGGSDFIQTYQFLSQAQQIDTFLIAPPPVCGQGLFITRDDYSGEIQTDKTDSIVQTINAGTLWMNYYGHGAPTVTDVSFGTPEDLSNTQGFPFFTAFACQSAAFAEPTIVCINELYVNQAATGFIASWGNSSFGDAQLDGFLCNDAYAMVAYDSLVQLGALTTQAKLLFWSELNYGIGQPYDSIQGSNTLMNQNLIGDPAMALAIRKHPEVEISDSDIAVRGVQQGIITDQDSAFYLHLDIHNNGFSSDDTMHVLVHDDFSAGSHDTVLTVDVPCDAESLLVAFPINHASGTHQITVTLDPDRRLKDEYRGDDIARAAVVVYSAVSTILRPQNFGSLASSCRPNVLTALIPQYGGSRMNYYFQLDTSSLFRSPVAVSPPVSPSNSPVVQWQIPLALSDNVAYYWRIRSYDPVKNDTSIWETSSFVKSGAPWQQIAASQFRQDALTSLSADSDGVRLGIIQGSVTIESRGYYVNSTGSVLRFVHFRLGSQTPYTNNQVRGIYFFVLSDTAFVLDPSWTRSFDLDNTPDSGNAQLMANFIDSIPTGRTVVAAVNDDIAGGLSQAGRDALKLLGAAQADSIGFRDSYALIGRKGAAPGVAPERRTPGGDSLDARLDTSLPFSYLRGTIVTPPIGPATQWGGAQWSAALPASTAGAISVYGLNHATGAYDLLNTYNAQAGVADLSKIDPRKYRVLELAASLSRNSTTQEPILQRWSVSFTGTPELLGYAPSLTISPDTVLEGVNSSLSTDVYNVGCVAATNILTQTILQNSGTQKRSGSQTIDSLGPMAAAHVQMPLATAGVRGLQSVVFTVDPFDSIAEPVKTNNTLVGSLYVQKDTTPPTLLVTVDGHAILNGDYVRPTPEIIVKVMDNSPLPIRDPSSIAVQISNLELGSVTYSAAKSPKNMTFATDSAGGVKATGDLHPDTLAAGTYDMRAYVYDATGNVDSSYDRQFQVVTDSHLEHVMNAPDPFQSNTNFTFVLSGELSPNDGVIKVYTVAGRLIRVINVPPTSLRVGFNAVPWDGTDEDGNRIANGVYIYKLIVHLPGQNLSEIEKLAVLR